MLALLLSFALFSAHAKDTSYDTTVPEVLVTRASFPIGLRPTSGGELHLRIGAPEEGGRTNRGLAARFGEREVAPQLKFRHVLALENRVFGTLQDGRLVEVSVSLERGRTIGRHWVGRATSAGLGAGGALVTAGAATGSVAMATVGAVLGLAGGVLPFVMPNVGFTLYMDWNVGVPGGDAAWMTETVVHDDHTGQIRDLVLIRDGERLLLSTLVRDGRDCAHYLSEGMFESNR